MLLTTATRSGSAFPRWLAGSALVIMVLGAWGLWSYWSSPSNNPLDYFDPEYVPGLVVTANGASFPAQVGPDEDFEFLITFPRNLLPEDREYVAFMLVHNVGQPHSPKSWISISRIRQVGEPPQQILARTRKSGRKLLSPPLLAPEEKLCRYFGHWNSTEFAEGIDYTKPLQLDLWFAEGSKERQLAGKKDTTLTPSVLVWTQVLTFNGAPSVTGS